MSIEILTRGGLVVHTGGKMYNFIGPGNAVRLANDAVRPEQWWKRSALAWDSEAMRELWAALLSDAVYCLKDGAFSRKKRLQIEHERARVWIFEDREIPQGLTFWSVCTALGLDPGEVRAQLARYAKSRFAYKSPRSAKVVSLADRWEEAE
jgi:hypothetical protein